MELRAIELSRAVYLTQMTRPSGQLYGPEAAQKLIARYSFAKFPSSIDELLANTIAFHHGKFGDSAIDELSIYSDGMIITSRSNTNFVLDFLRDLLEWTHTELGLVEVTNIKPAIFFDSQILVHTPKTLDRVLGKMDLVANLLASKLEEYGFERYQFVPFGVSFEVDHTKLAGRRPTKFSFERRLGIPFENNLYYSVAPLKTDDHLDLLSKIEAIF